MNWLQMIYEYRQVSLLTDSPGKNFSCKRSFERILVHVIKLAIATTNNSFLVLIIEESLIGAKPVNVQHSKHKTFLRRLLDVHNVLKTSGKRVLYLLGE